MNKERFFEKIKPFIDNNIVNELITTDEISIFNLNDVCYIICPFKMFNEKPGGVFGIITPAKYLVNYCKNPDNFYNDLHLLNKRGNIEKHVFTINERTFKHCMSVRDKYYSMPLTDTINREIEEQLKQMKEELDNSKSEEIGWFRRR